MSNEPDLKLQSIDHSDLPRGVVASLGDILAQISAAEHEGDFEKLIVEVNATRKKSDYSQHRNEELVIVAAKYRLLRFEILIRIILEHLQLPWNQAFARTNELIATLSPAVLAWLFFLSRDQSLMRFLVGVQIELEETIDIMISRTAEVAERQLVASFLQSNPSSMGPLLAAIQREAKKWDGPAPTNLYQPFRRADEIQDRRQVALEEISKACHRMADEEFQKLKSEHLREETRPKIKLPLNDPKKDAALDELLQAHWQVDIEETARFVLPVLNGERLPGKAYRGLSRHDLKFKAKKRNVKEVAIEDGDVHKSFTLSRESGSGVWQLDEERLERLNAMGLLPCKAADERTLEIIFRPSVIETLVGNRKTKRTKEATLRYILELRNGVSISEATKAANITRPTGYQILREIADLNMLED